jgi:ABC-2 type transport system ATP-binding protein
VRDLRERGTTVLLTTHAMDEAEQLCDRVAIISAGRLAAIGSPAELTADTGDGELRFSVEGDFELGALAAALGLTPDEIAAQRPGEFVVRAPGTPKLIAELACHLRDRGVLLTGLHSGRRTLEEVFLSLTRDGSA